MSEFKKRTCEKISFCDILNRYEQNVDQCLDSYSASLVRLEEKSLMHLTRLAENYLNFKQKRKRHLQETGVNAIKNSFSDTPVFKEKIKEKNNESRHETELKEKLKRIEVMFVEDQILNKTIENENLETLIESAVKEARNEKISDSSSYEMTDYSSNESSNDHDYLEVYKEEKDESLFAGFFSKDPTFISNKLSEAAKDTLSFQNMKLLSSPKKEKRLYIRQKKVPKWAENMKEVSETVMQQQRDEYMNPLSIYGICVVEMLDSNLIFQVGGKCKRYSSAKWNHPLSTHS